MRVPLVVLAALLMAAPVLPARAADPAAAAPPVRRAPAQPAQPAGAAGVGATIVLDAGGGRVFHTAKPIANLFVAEPKIAEARPASPNSVFVFGVGVGRTTVAALDETGNVLAQYDVLVRPSPFAANEAAGNVRRAIPGADVRMTATPDGITTDGTPANPLDADRFAVAARSYLGEKQRVDNRTSLTSSVQVTLKVRIAEIARNITRQLGINWTAVANFGRFGITGAIVDGLSLANNAPNTIGGSYTSGTNSVNTLLDLLAEDQLVTMLAEPNLTTRSGETASFLAGGEFPIPISANNGQIFVQFKQYGVALNFVPTVLTDGRISLHVRPEVSELTTNGAVTVPVATSLFGTSTITIPALTVRRADTTVELGSGQSFAIAGLLQGQNELNARGLPWLGEIPVLGPLFKSDLFQRNESELVIVVTPYLVSPVSAPGALRAPTDDYVPPGDLDRLVLLRQRARGTGPEANLYPAGTPLGAPQPAGLNAGRLPAGTGFMLP